MKRIRSSGLLALTAGWLLACGGSSSKPIVTPQTSTFAFMQQTTGLSYKFTPMLGKFSTANSTTVFTATPVVDTSTNLLVDGEFYSIILSPDGKKGVFDLYGGLDRTSGQWDIWVADLNNTSNPVQITNDVNDDAMPQFSPDGSKIVFTSNRTGSMHQVVIRDLYGPGEQVLPVPLNIDWMWAPTYSPDGTKLAMEAWGYDTNNNEFEGILVMNAADGSNPQMLTGALSADCLCRDTVPSFTADGTKIVFARIDETYLPATADIYIMRADGTGLTRLTDGVGANFDPLTLTIAGVGERILFSSNRDNLTGTLSDGFDMYSMNADGTGMTRLTTNATFDGFSAMWQQIGGTAQVGSRAQHAQHHAPGTRR